MSAVKKILLASAVGATLALAAAGPISAAPTPAPPSKKAPAAAPAAAHAPLLPSLTASQILEKHVAARGGASAWKSVQTLQLSGKIDAGRGDGTARAMQMVESSKKASGKGTAAEIAAANGPKADATQVQLPFTMDLKRSNKTRLEIQFAGTTSVQVYDGKQGWKLRPYLNRSNAEPFNAEEAQAEASRDDLDGPLIGSPEKGSKVSLDGTELVDGQAAYRLKVVSKRGEVRHVWIDGKTFLDVKMDGSPHRMDGKVRNVYVYQRDFRSVQGVMIPFEMETAVDGYPDRHKMTIEKATINPPLDNALFAKPHV
jgi:hypothetical protein